MLLHQSPVLMEKVCHKHHLCSHRSTPLPQKLLNTWILLLQSEKPATLKNYPIEKWGNVKDEIKEEVKTIEELILHIFRNNLKMTRHDAKCLLKYMAQFKDYLGSMIGLLRFKDVCSSSTSPWFMTGYKGWVLVRCKQTVEHELCFYHHLR